MSSNKIDIIHDAKGDGSLGKARALLKAGGIKDNADADQWTPLIMVSVIKGHLEVAQQLRRRWRGKTGHKRTARHVAAANDGSRCCQLLLDRGSNPRAVDEKWRTP
ncbi:unnamed protein product, partial [Ectocarpus sp. 8 AP-2014]